MSADMQRQDGIAAARYIRKFDKRVAMILTAESEKRAIEGYAVNALDYIIKPFDYPRLKNSLLKAMDILDVDKRSYLLLSDENGTRRVFADEIKYIDCYNHKVTVHAKCGEFTFFGTIKALENKLDNIEFYRANSCYLVNLNCIEKYDKDTLSIGGANLRISRDKRKGLFALLASRGGGELNIIYIKKLNIRAKNALRRFLFLIFSLKNRMAFNDVRLQSSGRLFETHITSDVSVYGRLKREKHIDCPKN